MIDSGFGVCYSTFVKSKLSRFFGLCIGLATVSSLSVYGCGHSDYYIPCDKDNDCWPDPTIDIGYKCYNHGCYPPCKTEADCDPEDTCVGGHCTPPWAVPDAGGDASADASSVRCSDTCTPYPEGWSSAPAVWHGPVDKAPRLNNVPLELGGPNTLPIFEGYADIHAAPATCDVCTCAESTGTCTELPETISIRAAKCGEAAAGIEFGGPANWDGSCTDTYAMPAGKTCPAGSSTLCAQSVAVSALGPPSEESCAPMVEELPVLRFGANPPQWKTTAVGYKVPGCEDQGSCMPKLEGLPSGYQSCIYKRGEHECPAAWSNDRFVVYERTADKPGYIDGRDCTPCSCGTPMGSACTGRFRTFEDGTCTNLLADVQVSSLGEQCTNFFPPGPAVGSKEITGLTYLPGFCEVTGGEPIGKVTADPGQAVTVCCMKAAAQQQLQSG
ncbi:MAG TPA: hypothetical protein PK156_16045 [Polyangium sp.]|nr:hypothetical protein [Polyangium sp.]